MKKTLTTLALSAAAVFVVAAPAQADEPIIEEVEARVTENTVIITWTTDVETTGNLEYGTTTGSYTASKSTDMDTEHQVILSGLASKTTYYYRITATDDEGNEVMTEELSFTTQGKGVKITKLEVIAQSATKIVVLVETNKRAKLSIKYGTSPDTLTETANKVTLTSLGSSTHAAFLMKKLKRNTTYYFQAHADRSGFILETGEEPSTAESGIGIVETTGKPKITSVTPKSGGKGTKVTIRGENFGEKANAKNDIVTTVAFGGTVSKWPGGGGVPSVVQILSWSDTKIVVKFYKNGGQRTGAIYIGKAFDDGISRARLYVVKGPTFTVKGK